MLNYIAILDFAPNITRQFYSVCVFFIDSKFIVDDKYHGHNSDVYN